MTTITTHNLRTYAAIQFINSMNASNNSLYCFEGGNLPWPNESFPPVPVDSLNQDYSCWSGMLFAKLVTENNLSLVAARHNWKANTVYTAYSDTNTNLFNTPYYMITSNNEVYKCIANNYGALSTQQPSGLGSATTNYIQTMSDGYQWKYMLQVQPGDAFLNNDWFGVPLIPPPNSLQSIVAAAAVDGSIDHIHLVSGGTKYANSAQSYIVVINGNGTGANAYANVVNNSIVGINLTTRGQGYNYATISFNDLNGVGANAVAIISPKGGNGSNAAIELGCTTVEVIASVANNESGYITTSNQFRQNGLLLNPLTFGSNTVSSNARVKPYTTLNMSGGVGTYALNEVVFQGININNATFTGIIIDFDPVLLVSRVNYITGTPSIGNILYGVSSGTQRYIASIVNPDVELYTGEFIEIDNEIAIQRSVSQTESFQYIIQF